MIGQLRGMITKQLAEATLQSMLLHLVAHDESGRCYTCEFRKPTSPKTTVGFRVFASAELTVRLLHVFEKCFCQYFLLRERSDQRAARVAHGRVSSTLTWRLFGAASSGINTTHEALSSVR